MGVHTGNLVFEGQNGTLLTLVLLRQKRLFLDDLFGMIVKANIFFLKDMLFFKVVGLTFSLGHFIPCIGMKVFVFLQIPSQAPNLDLEHLHVAP